MNILMEEQDEFYTLITSWKSSHQEFATDNHMLQLQDNVQQLIAHNQDHHRLFAEASGSEEQWITGHTFNPAKRAKYTHDNWSAISVQQCMRALHHRSLITNCPLSVSAATFCAQKLADLSENVKPDTRLTNEQQEAITTISSVIKQLTGEQSFSRDSFLSLLTRKRELSIQVLWQLHCEGVVKLSEFVLSNMGTPDVIAGYTAALVAACVACNEGTVAVLSAILRECIRSAFGTVAREDEPRSRAAKVCRAMLDKVVGRLLEAMSAGTLDARWCCPLADLHASAEAGDANRSFRAHAVRFLLSYKCLVKPSDAVSRQEEWTYARSPLLLTAFYKSLLQSLALEEAAELLEGAVRKQEVNWQRLLAFTATLLVQFPRAAASLRAIIDGLLKEALEGGTKEESLLAGLLLARQASLEGPHVFPSYGDWFSTTFGTPRSPAGTRKSFSFLVGFLTKLARHESPRFLVAHVTRLPYVPPKCRHLLSDYLALARTRLDDMNVSLEQVTMVGEGGAGVAGQGALCQLEDRAKRDVEGAVAVFEKTQKVPSTLMEQSIFHKPYYIGKFLPMLLEPRPLPDVPDTKMKLIESLRLLDKIPKQLYSSYENGCRREMEQLLEGVFDSDSDDIATGPLEKLEQHMDMLISAVLDRSLSKPKKTVSEQLSRISELLHDATKLHAPSTTDSAVVDNSAAGTIIQVVDVILNSFCKIEAAVMSQEMSAANTGHGHTDSHHKLWASQFVSVLAGIPELHAVLCRRLMALLCNESDILEDEHLIGLSLLVLETSRCETRILARLDSLSSASVPIVDLVADHLSTSTGAAMKQTLKFCTAFIDRALLIENQTLTTVKGEAGAAYVPVGLATKFRYLVPRLCPETRWHGIAGAACYGRAWSEERWSSAATRLWYLTPVRTVLDSCLMTFEQWIQVELAVKADTDAITYLQRHNYRRWAVHALFIPVAVNLGGCGGCHQRACTTILHALVQEDEQRNICKKNLWMAAYHSNNNPCSLVEKPTSPISRCEVIALLQELVLLLPVDGVPWLLEQSALYCAHENVIQPSGRRSEHCESDQAPALTSTDDTLVAPCSLEREAMMVAFVCLVQSLPAYLLFTNQPNQKIHPDVCRKVLNLILHMKRDFQGVCGLEYDVTTYLCKGIVMAAGTCGTETELVLMRMLQDSNLLTASMLFHWPTLWITLSQLCQCYKTNKLKSVFSNMNCIYTDVNQLVDIHGVVSSLTGEPWMVAMCLYSCCYHDVNKRLQSLKPDCVEVVQWLLVCISTDYVQLVSSNSREGLKLSVLLLSMCPEAVCVFDKRSQPNRIQEEILSELQVQLLSSSFFRILITVQSEGFLGSVQTVRGFLCILLDNHRDLCQLLTHSQPSSDYSWLSYHQVVSMESVLQASRLVMQCLRDASHDALLQLSEQGISTEDEEINCFIKSRLQK
ncbi:PREDICTED: Fanconi anemia group A protein homolog [Priapulus caudatus]|uniref:Fanconi anemia group A protein homolog n=1 Tax=Priapulus caudatus TaxID=37621 RepID=A0ABM1ECB9_PRICU|nr:PREDICTED: Fanconi anemia group A protein homolog [Priapulus caudatus]